MTTQLNLRFPNVTSNKTAMMFHRHLPRRARPAKRITNNPTLRKKRPNEKFDKRFRKWGLILVAHRITHITAAGYTGNDVAGVGHVGGLVFTPRPLAGAVVPLIFPVVHGRVAGCFAVDSRTILGSVGRPAARLVPGGMSHRRVVTPPKLTSTGGAN